MPGTIDIDSYGDGILRMLYVVCFVDDNTYETKEIK